MDECTICEGIGIGGVPSDEGLKRLVESGVKTLLDAREAWEGGADLEAKASALGLRYIHAPISRSSVELDQIDRFKQAVSDPANGKVYAFSSAGARPAGALCFLACAETGDSIIEVFHKAKNCGCPIDKEFALKKFILDFYSSHRGDMLNNYFQRPRHA
jgi:uncharacterized protein (TIGR01244 family)